LFAINTCKLERGIEMDNTEHLVREIEEFYRGYIDAFNREDIDLYLRMFDLPYVVVSGGRPATVVADEASRQTFYTQMMIGIQGSGWSRSDIDLMKAWPLGEKLATLLADVTRYKRDGSTLEHIRAFYTLRKDSKAWKIVALSEIRAPFTGPGDIARP
jgi:ketosteroid isomerase-like protein